MGQSGIITGDVSITQTETVNVALLDVERRIQQYTLTIIGRVWNPRF